MQHSQLYPEKKLATLNAKNLHRLNQIIAVQSTYSWEYGLNMTCYAQLKMNKNTYMFWYNGLFQHNLKISFKVLENQLNKSSRMMWIRPKLEVNRNVKSSSFKYPERFFQNTNKQWGLWQKKQNWWPSEILSSVVHSWVIRRCIYITG